MPGFIRWQSKNSIGVFVPTGKRYPSGQPVRHYETIRRAPGETDKQLEARASARRAELELQYYHGDYLAVSKRRTVADLLDAWLAGPVAEKLVIGKLAESTRDWYEMNVRVHLKPVLGDYLLSALTEADIESAYRKMAAAGATEATVAGVHRTLRAALNWAIRGRLLRVNPANLLEDAPVAPDVEHPTLPLAGALALLESARDDPKEAAILVAMLTGARISEVLGLRKDDLDFDAGVIHIRHQLKRPGPQTSFKRPKSRKSVRDIPMTPMLADILRGVLARQEAVRADRERRGLVVYDHGLVFTIPNGRPLNRRNLGRKERTFGEMLRRAELPENLRLHDLRHSFATLAKELGEDSKRVADALGHADTALVDRRYAHRSMEAQRKLYGRIEQSIQRKKRTKSQGS